MWIGIQQLAHNISLFFGQDADGHRQCPNCKGSGLLHPCTRMNKILERPCWFCDGIGAVPIIGMNGFILAKSTSIIQVSDYSAQPYTSSLLNDQPGVIPQRCCFTTFKPSGGLFDVVHDFNELPTWLGVKNENIQPGLWPLRHDPHRNHSKIGADSLASSQSLQLQSSSPNTDHPSKYTGAPKIVSALSSEVCSVQPNANSRGVEKRAQAQRLGLKFLWNVILRFNLLKHDHRIKANEHYQWPVFQFAGVLTGPSPSTSFGHGTRCQISSTKGRSFLAKALKEPVKRSGLITRRAVFHRNEQSDLLHDSASDYFRPLISGRLPEVSGNSQESSVDIWYTLPFMVLARTVGIVIFYQSWLSAFFSRGPPPIAPKKP